MIIKKLFLLVLIVTSATNLHAVSTHEIRTMGLVTAGVLVTLGGVHVLCRKNSSVSDKIFEVLGGLILIGAGLTGIVMSGQISKEIENAFR